jgi:rhodanese-related sulfurtransferase
MSVFLLAFGHDQYYCNDLIWRFIRYLNKRNFVVIRLSRAMMFGLLVLSLCHLGLLEVVAQSSPAGPADRAAGEQTVDKTQKKVRPVFRTITSVEAQQMLKERSDLVFIDVRTPQEREQARIDGSQLIGVGDVMRGKLDVPKDKPVLLVCAVGGRSWVAGKALAAMGYLEVYNLDGGIEAWYRAGLPVEFGAEAISGK